MKRGKLWIAICAIAVSVMAGCLAACGGSSHKTVLHEAKAATCTEQGNEVYYSCEHCNKLFADADAKTEVKREDVFHAALGHEISDDSYVEGQPNSCTEAGVLAHYTCSRCHNAFADKAGTVLIADTVLPAGHSLGDHFTYIAPSIAAEGRAEYYVCNDCGKYFTDAACKQEISSEDTVLPRVPEYSVAITVKTCDKDGNESAIPEGFVADIHSPVALDAEYVLSVATDGTATNDKNNDGKYAAGTYRINADGFYSARFTIAETDTKKEITLYALDRTLSNPDSQRYITGMRDENGNKFYTFDKDYSSGAWNTLGMLELADKTGEQSYMYDFSVSLAQTPSADWNNRLLLAFADSDTANGFGGGKDVVGIGMALSAENLALYNLQQNWEDRTNTPKEYGATGSTASDRAIMSAFYRSAMNGGLAMRVARLRDTVHFYVNINDSWILFRTVTLSDKSDNGFVIAALGNADITVSQIQEGIYVPIAETDDAITLEHFEMDGTWYDANGVETTQSALTKSFVSLTSFKAVPNGFTLSETVEGVISASDVSYEIQIGTDGAITRKDGNPNKFVPGTYTVKPADGYYTTEIEITENTTSVSFDLYRIEEYFTISNPDGFDYVAPIVNDGKKEIVIDRAYADNTTWSQLGLLEIANPNRENGGTLFMTEFTMRLDGAGNADWTQRLQFAFASADKLRSNAANGTAVVGFYMFFPTNLTKVGSATAKWDERYQESQPNITEAFMSEAAAGTLRVRVVRNDTYAALYMKLGGVWQKLHEVTLTSSAVDGGFSITGTGVQKLCFSDFTFAEYASEVPPTGSANGMKAHFTLGDDYFDLNGAETTQDALVIELVVLDSFTVNADFDLTVPVSGKLIGANGVDYNITISTDGTVSNGNENKYVADTYMFTAGGYAVCYITINADSKEIEFDLFESEYSLSSPSNKPYAAIETVEDGKHNVVFNTGWDGYDSVSGIALWEIADNGNSPYYMLDFVAESAITTTADSMLYKNRLYLLGSSKAKIDTFTNVSTTGHTGLCMRFAGDLHYAFETTTQDEDTEGRFKQIKNYTVKLRVVRNGNEILLYEADEAGAWTLVGRATMAVFDNGLTIAARCACDTTLSGIVNYQYVRTVEPTLTEDGVAGHFIDTAGNLYDLEGKITDLEALKIKRVKIDSFTVDPEEPLTHDISGVLSGQGYTYNVTIDHTTNAVTCSESNNYFISGTYTFTADGCFPAEVVIGKDTTSVKMTLNLRKYTLYDSANKTGSAVETEDEHNVVFNTGWDGYNSISEIALWEVAGNDSSPYYMLDFVVNSAFTATGITPYKNRLYILGSSKAKIDTFTNVSNTGYTGLCMRFVGDLQYAVEMSDYSEGAGTFKQMSSDHTVKLRIVRNGNEIKLYEADSAGAWSLVGSVNLGVFDNGLTIAARCDHNTTVSQIVKYDYVAETKTADAIVRAHFKDGSDNWFTLDGAPVSDKTAMQVAIATPLSFTVSGHGGVATDAKLAGSGMVLDVQIAEDGTVTRKDRETWYPAGNVTLMLTGYKALTLAISSGAEVSGTLEVVTYSICGSESGAAKITETDGTYTLATPWDDAGTTAISDMGYLQLVDGETAGNYAVEFDLSGGTGSGMTRIYFAAADYETAQNIDIASTDTTKIVGISLRHAGNNGILCDNLYQRYREDAKQTNSASFAQRYKIERKGSVMTISYLNGSNWVQLHSVTLDSALTDNGLGIFGTAGSSNVSISNITFTPIAD